ncbi:MAG: hypothetical protein KDC79_07540 [Cyclobacteriaceae bacterium]|nr:hypothetical protein [Cyclobacteriaceae bacterium]
MAQVNTPKYANEFLAIGVGARAAALGNAHVAIANDVTAGYWNPAGLLRQTTDYSGILQHAEYFSGIAKYDYAAFNMPLDTLSALGFSLIRFGIDDIPDTRFLYDASGAINYDNVRFFSAADYAFFTSYARKIPLLGGLQLGGSFKIIHRKAGQFASAWGFGLDVGAQYKLKEWQFGAMFRDVTGTFTAWTHNSDSLIAVYSQTGNTIPSSTLEVALPRLVLGAGRYFTYKKFGFLPTLDFTITFDGKRNTLLKSSLISAEPTAGLEVSYASIAYLRVGIKNFQELKNFDSSTYLVAEPTFGLGFSYHGVALDYALNSVGVQTKDVYTHVFSLMVSLDKKE